MTLPENAAEMRPQTRPVTVVPHARHVLHFLVEPLHILHGQLVKCISLESESVQSFVDLGDVGPADPAEHVVRESRAPVRSGDGGEGEDFGVGGLEAGDHIAGVEPAG